MNHFDLRHLFKVGNSSTTTRTLIFTLGHFLIDTLVIAQVTGAAFNLAGRAALLGPLINGVWYWSIDRWWTLRHMEIEHNFKSKPEGQRHG